jgi:hypothetical protein
MNPIEANPDNLVTRAYAAYYKAGGGELPVRGSVEIIGGKLHVILFGRTRVVAGFRVRGDTGQLRRLRRLPKELRFPLREG